MVTIVIPIILGVAAVLSVIRLISLRQVSGKAVVLDVLTTITTGMLIIAALLFDSSFLLDITLIYAILSFAAVLVVARYMERSI